MRVIKTKCKHCYHIGANVNQKPCSECGEIQLKIKKFDNHFLDADKNLMREV